MCEEDPLKGQKPFATADVLSQRAMQSARVLPTSRPAVRRTRGATLHVVPDPAPLPEPIHPAERRLRDAGGPDDRATYSCECGYLFEAPVSTTVSCPNCGVQQAW